MRLRVCHSGYLGTEVISWNLLRLTGAGVEDVAALVKRHHPDLLFVQEATEEMADLPALVGGYFFREPLEGRIYGLAVWSPHPLLRPYALGLPVSQVPGRVPPRVAQIVQLVVHHSDFDVLIPSHLRIGKLSGGTRISMLLGTPG